MILPLSPDIASDTGLINAVRAEPTVSRAIAPIATISTATLDKQAGEAFTRGDVVEGARLMALQYQRTKPAVITEEVPQDQVVIEIPPFSAKKEGRIDSHNAACVMQQKTDLGNSERFSRRYGRNVRYCNPFKAWFVWNGCRWEQDKIKLVQELAKDAARLIVEEAERLDGDARKQHVYWGIVSEARARIDAMIALATSSMPITPDEMDTNNDLLNCSNGTLNLSTFEFTDARRDDVITKVTGCRYDPKATCPTWDRFMGRIMAGNSEMTGYLQRAAGYSLTGHTGERALFLPYGRGANGKSTFLDTMAAVVGEYGKSVDPNTFCVSRGEAVRNDIAALKGARLVISTEAGKGKRLDEAIIKQLTGGGDKMTARFLNQEYFEFTPLCKIWWAFNSMPRIIDNTDSIWDRVKLIPFLVVIPEGERDTGLQGKLHKELPGILNWMLNGLRDFQRSGLCEPVEVKEATKGYRDEQDSLADFFSVACVTDQKASCGVTDLYNAYSAWANHATQDEIKPPRSFGQDMSDRGFMKVKDSRSKLWMYKGIRIKAVGEHNGL